MDCAATVAAPIAMAGESDLTLKGSLECTTMPSNSSIGKETSQRHIYITLTWKNDITKKKTQIPIAWPWTLSTCRLVCAAGRAIPSISEISPKLQNFSKSTETFSPGKGKPSAETGGPGQARHLDGCTCRTNCCYYTTYSIYISWGGRGEVLVS